MEKIETLAGLLFDKVSQGDLSKSFHKTMIVEWISKLSVLIENIRETSIHDVDAKKRLEELSEKSGLNINILWKFYDRS